MLNTVEAFFRKLRQWFSRSEWLIRLLRLTKAQGAASEPGLVLIQIDGLSRTQLERAMAKGHLPFLTQLLRKQKYRLHSLYSGLPSSTPAMTAELLYGIKCAVPAFSFYDRSRKTVFRMFDFHNAKEIERRLQARGPALLAGGSAYAGIYTGGAAETHFCASVMGLDDLFRARYPLRLFIILLLSVYSLLRVGILLAIEFLLALFDCVRGLIAGQDLWKELKFVPSRVGVSILMRELATIGAKIDVTRGLPTVYLDLVGYDEQAHRRGPNSRFAHWTLKGIDLAIARIWKTAMRSAQRDYDVWIFSDHGSEEMVPYVYQNGRALPEAIAEAFDGTVKAFVVEHDGAAVRSRRTGLYVAGRSNIRPQLLLRRPRQEPPVQQQQPVVAAMGPLGHLYIEQRFEGPERNRLAQALVERARIPMVTVVSGEGHVRVWTAEGAFLLPEDAARVFGPSHPFLADVTEDFIALCRHPDAGDFVLWGWSRSGYCCTFPLEHGSHGGPGPEETHGFALLPDDAPVHARRQGYARPLDLREAALRCLAPGTSLPVPAFPVAAVKDVLRVMTYNIHICVGLDGKLSPRRIARVIARYRPDVVALQEVDVGRARTGRLDQAGILAGYLGMDRFFNPAIQVGEESYGDCILSRLPMRLVKEGILPMSARGFVREPREALWVAVELDGTTIHVVNTHLGLDAKERLLHLRMLLGEDWLGGQQGRGPVIFCGDLNATPQSAAWKLCTKTFRDVQLELPDQPPRPTWLSHHPIARIDHIFVSSQVHVMQVEVDDDYLARVASDHRPLFAALKVQREPSMLVSPATRDEHGREAVVMRSASPSD